MGLLAGALRRRTCSLHGWQEKEEEIEKGDSRQRAFSSGCCSTSCRGAAGVVAHGTTAVGAISDDPHGCTNDGGDCSDGPDSHAHNGGDCRPDGADSCAHSNVGDASDANGSDSDARGRWDWRADVADNGWWRLRNAGDALDSMIWWTLGHQRHKSLFAL